MFRKTRTLLLTLALPVALALATPSWREQSPVPVEASLTPSGQAGRPSDPPCDEPPPRPRPEQRLEPAPGEKVPYAPVAPDGTAAPTRTPGFASANYLTLTGVKLVLLTDTHGHSTDPLNDRPTGQTVERVKFDKVGPDGVMITAPTDETYTVTFQARGGAVALDLVRGVGNEFPELAVRYLDLLVPEGVTAMFKATPQGIEPVRRDKDGDGTFETEIKPDAFLTGAAANDTRGPTICFGESRQGASVLLSIAAADSSGVKAIYYSLNAWSDEDMAFRLYGGPVQVEPAKTAVVYAFADDRAGNRSGIYDFRLTGGK